MSMMCCEKCGAAVDTDFHPEMFREGFKLHHIVGKGHIRPLIKTGDPKDCAAICDYCFEEAGYEEE